MDDLNLYGKSEVQIHSLVKIMQLVSTDIGMEFGIKKCGVLILKRGKVVECEGIVLPNGEKMKTIEDEGYKYLRILEMDEIKEEAMKNRFKKECLRRLRLILRSKFDRKNNFQTVKSWAVALLGYGTGIVKWSNGELRGLDGNSRKLFTVDGNFHTRSVVDRLYPPRGIGGMGLMSCESCVRAEENGIGC